MKSQLNRRRFIRQNLLLAAAAGMAPQIVSFPLRGQSAPNNRVQLACIGVGPQGRGVMSGFLAQNDVRVILLADPYQPNLEAAVQQVNGHYRDNAVQTTGDYRAVLERKDVDAVSIATPDHWHVPVALAAAKARKDMYLEKPMGLSLEEDQLLRRWCQKNKIIFQFGTQQRSSREFHTAVQAVRNGRIGRLKQINVWCSASRPGGSTEVVPVPPGLNYDLWLGPAPFTPYTEGKVFDTPKSHKTWWFNYDYALGFIAGWGVHPLDIAYWGMPEMMNGPVTIEGQGVIPTSGACNTAVAWEVWFTFANGVKLRYRGTKNGYSETTPMTDFSDWQQRYGKIVDHGTAFEGEEGWVHVYRGGVFSNPEKAVQEPLRPNETPLYRSTHHQRNLIECMRSRQPTVCPIEDSVQADILCHLSDLAVRLKRKLVWDPKKEQFVKDNEANRHLKIRSTRKPYQFA
ncbi:MAG: Gfo/Idh/MocA family oxidoreductase [Verrucomicrobiae bacterium]|nr:Gfo/Idh/MocA family oxidoreductase [Verrucomicrobiae bacterium]